MVSLYYKWGCSREQGQNQKFQKERARTYSLEKGTKGPPPHPVVLPQHLQLTHHLSFNTAHASSQPITSNYLPSPPSPYHLPLPPPLPFTYSTCPTPTYYTFQLAHITSPTLPSPITTFLGSPPSLSIAPWLKPPASLSPPN